MSGQRRVDFLLASGLRRFAFILICIALLMGCALAQETAAVPNLVKFSGSIASSPSASLGVIFALYKDPMGGAPLWQEVQTVTVDASGHYTALLGSTSSNGIPVDLFSSNEARWLGVQLQGQPEQSRVLLVSVPYAMKAADAQTLGGLPASAFLRSDASTSTTSSYVNTAAVTSAVANISTSPAITSAITSMMGSIPVFTDTIGGMGNSVMVQANGNIGVGTSSPAFNMHVVGSTDPAAIAIEGYGAVGVNFIGRRAQGTQASPAHLNAGDNIFILQGRGYGTTGFSPGSRASIKMIADENWSDTAQGTDILFATTSDGTASAGERMRLTHNGNLGIGTTTPANPLSVNGVIQSMAGGFKFPDGTTQTTAASGSGGVTMTSPDTSITVGGTMTAPTVAVNTANIQKRVNAGTLCSSGFAIHSINQDGSVTCVAASGSGGVSIPVTWNASATTTTQTGVLTVTNTANGPAEPSGPPPSSFFSTIPTAVVGKASGTGIVGGVAGIATGSTGVGVFAYTATSHLGALLAWNGLTGYAGTNDFPKALSANLANETGGTVIKAESMAATAPAPCNSGNCQQLTGVSVNMDATSGVTVGLQASLNSPASQGLDLNFNVAPTSGSMINANVNNNGVGPSTFFQVDGNANINTSGTLNIGTGTGTSVINGNLQVNGNLSKSSGTFKIDHPLDPANKFLYHSFVESPDMMNIYNGVIVLDKHGKAVVDLPNYFEALNQDFRYQLTSIGAPGPNLFVASEIKGNKFIIAGGKPGAKVSWQVTGIRHDAYADAHRIVVEEDKGKERGTYLHPELFQKDPVVAKK